MGAKLQKTILNLLNERDFKDRTMRLAKIEVDETRTRAEKKKKSGVRYGRKLEKTQM